MSFIAYIIFLIGAATRYIFGFGEALVTTPLLLLIAFNSNDAVALIGILGLGLAAPAVVKNYRYIDLKLIIKLVSGAIIGVPFGLIFLKLGNTLMLKYLVGIFLIIYGILNLIKLRPRQKSRFKIPVFVAGLFSGFMGGAINTHGAPIAIYGQLAKWPTQYLRANLQTYFGIIGLVIVLGQGLSGLWNFRVGLDLILLLPGVASVIFILEKKLNYINIETLNKYLYGFLIFSGCLMFI